MRRLAHRRAEVACESGTRQASFPGKIFIDGDLAFVHVRYLDWAVKETAGVDIFRFDADGKVVEHWDVLQPVPGSSNNPNTMF